MEGYVFWAQQALGGAAEAGPSPGPWGGGRFVWVSESREWHDWV